MRVIRRILGRIETRRLLARMRRHERIHGPRPPLPPGWHDYDQGGQLPPDQPVRNCTSKPEHVWPPR